MTLLVFGRTGQVACALRALTDSGAYGPVDYIGRDVGDLSQPESCAEVIRARAPHAVINAAAYTAVDRAEDEEALATVINATAPTAMALACAASDIPFVHISTDYVFPGSGITPWRPEDPVSPLNAYGRSKRAGEEGVMAAGGRWAILRTSWVFSETGSNFVKTMLRLSETRDALNVVADQIGGPTPAAAIAAACLEIATQLSQAPEKAGLYHFSGAPDASWADFATTIFACAGRSVSVTPIPSSAYPTPAQRPLNSRLDCQSLETAFGITRPDWRAALPKIVHPQGADHEHA